MTEPVLLVEKKGRIAVLTLNRPDKMNALSYDLRQALADELDALRTDRSTGVVIITGAGPGFCAGLDLKELANPPSGKAPLLDPPAQIRSLPQPVIGAVNGVAITGGFEIATSCDFLIGSHDAKFADTHARVGILPGWGLSQRLPRIIGINRAKELSLTGNFLTAERALEWGLLNRIVSAADLLSTCIALAEDMLTCDEPSAQKLKRLMDDGWDLPLGEAMALESKVNREHKCPTSEELTPRRLKIQKRGRQQTGKAKPAAVNPAA